MWQNDGTWRPYQGWGEWYSNPPSPQAAQGQAAPWQSAFKPMAQPGGGGGGMGGATTLADLITHTPATPQYAGLDMPNLPNYAMPTAPSLSNYPSVAPPPDIQIPAMSQYGPAAMPSPMEVPQLPTMGAISRPDPLAMPNVQSPAGSLVNPSLGPGVSLSEMAGLSPEYQSPDWGMFAQGQASPINVPSFAGGAGSVGGAGGAGGIGGPAGAPSPTMISSGVTPPPPPAPPQAGSMPTLSGLGGMGGQAAARASAQAMGPGMMQLQQQHYANAADYGNRAQQAQSQSGLGWGGLAQQRGDLLGSNRVAQQNNMLGFLGSMMGRV